MVEDTVAILGGKGMLGTDLACICEQQGFNVEVFDLPEFDITNLQQLKEALNAAKTIVNCAAYTDVDGAESEAKEAYRVNAEAVGQLGELVKEANSWLLHISTDFVFDGTLDRPYIEADNPNPINEYGKTKLAGENAGIQGPFVQDNASFSKKGVLRGLHFQYPQPQGKLVQVLSGQVVDVAVDIRVGSPTFGHWVSEVLSDANHRQIYIPPGFAHGYCVTSETAVLSYKCTDFYNPETESGIIWNDPDLNIDWPTKEPVLSPKDADYSRLKDLRPDKLPHFRRL